MPSDHGEWLCSAGFVIRCSAELEGLQEGQQRIVRAEPRGGLAGGCKLSNGLFLHFDIRFQVTVSGLDALVTKPKSDDGDVHSGQQKVHCGGMPNAGDSRRWRADFQLALERSGRSGPKGYVALLAPFAVDFQ